jgi:hypothetical protein
VNFLKNFYLQHRDELVRYALKFDQCRDTALDLFEDCHDKICKLYPMVDSVEYVKIMKRAMGNLYTDHLRKAGYLERCKFPEAFSPITPLSVVEQVCKEEELGILREALSLMTSTDQEILLRDKGSGSTEIKSYQKYQAIKRLERTVIEVIASKKMKDLKGIHHEYK